MIGETWKPFVANGAARSLTRGAAAAQMAAFASAVSAGAFGFRRFFLASPQQRIPKSAIRASFCRMTLAAQYEPKS
jgi:hypothetical protein